MRIPGFPEQCPRWLAVLCLALQPLVAQAAQAPASLAATTLEDAAASDDPEQAFAGCVLRLQDVARRRGVAEDVVTSVLGQVRYNGRVIELDRRQPEFTQTFADYFNARVTDTRVQRGRELLAEQRELLARVQTESGVPAQYLVAFWGLETNFGGFLGRMSVPDALATLACDGRRGEFFTDELVAALRIIEAGDIDAAGMEGSWAGAVGQMQFMPTSFLRHAVDADGDGKRDLWSSAADALASAGHLLQSAGWRTGERWGREVVLPPGFDYALAGRSHSASLTQWRALGVTTTAGEPLPAIDLPARLLVPAGHAGPAFLTYPNFDVIMRWNRSEYYALAVGHLADRIAGAGRLHQPLPDTGMRLTRTQVQTLQTQLQTLGHDVGTPDGVIGPATRAALAQFQRASGRVPDGYLDADLLRAVATAAAALETSAGN
ncbi:MAG: lytic murein transglycosylase [Pseudomonadales bacterium]